MSARLVGAFWHPSPSVLSPKFAMTSTPLHIRHARAGDLETLRCLAERTFRDTFAADNDPADMQRYMGDAFSEQRLRAELADGAGLFLLAFADGTLEPIGYARLRTGEAHASVAGPSRLEIERLYVERAAIGHGVGAALMEAILAEAGRLGKRTLWLGVWERNTRAIAFYRRWGFEVVGSHVFWLGTDEQTDLIMQRRDDGAR